MLVVAKTPTGAPTLYRRRLADIPKQIRHGDLVAISTIDDDQSIWAHGIVNPRAEASVRILTRGNTVPDESWWRNQIRQAVQLRKLLDIDAVSNAYRVIHAEGDGLPEWWLTVTAI